MTHAQVQIQVQVPLNYDPDVVAFIFDPAGADDDTSTSTVPELPLYDEVGNWESALQYAHEGFVVVPVNGDGFRSLADLEEMVAREYELVADCFGRRAPRVWA